MSHPIRTTLYAAAHYSLWFPATLTAYFIVRATSIDTSVFCLAALLALVHIHRTCPVRLPTDRALDPESKRESFLGLVILLLIATAPTVPIALQFAFGSYPTGFTNADESYNFMIARALEQSFPPVDLGYQGRLARYHLGGPLLSEMLSRLGLPLHFAFFLVWPLLLRLTAVAVSFKLILILAPRLTTTQALLGVLAANAVFVINPYNVLWNIRNSFNAGGIETASLLYGMPVVNFYGDFLRADFQYGSSLAALLTWLLIVNMRTAHWLWLSCTLFAAFLAKSSVFVPLGLAWAAWSAYQVLRHRVFREAWAGAVALALCLYTKSFTFEPGIVTPQAGAGYGFDWLVQHGNHFANSLHLPDPLAAALAALVLLVTGSHIYGWSIWRTGLQHNPVGWVLLIIVAISSGFIAFTVFQVDPVAQVRFLQVHEPIAPFLWRPVDSYFFEQWKLSVGEARVLVSTGLAMFAAAAASTIAWTAQRGQAIFARVALLVSAAVATMQITSAAYAPDQSRWKIIPSSTVQALQAMPVRSTVILTNDCAYDAHVERHLPLMNAALPSLFGHQFWACNLMFNNNFAATDAVSRLERQGWFWRTPPGADHLAFLRQAGITHLLVARRLDRNGLIERQFSAQEWIAREVVNTEYVVLRVTG